MATADQVKALIRSHNAGDQERFYAVVLQMAAKEARSGHAGYASDLKALIEDGRQGSNALRAVPVTAPRGELAAILTASYPEHRLADLVLDKPITELLRRVLAEQRQSERLRSSGFEPLRKLLLVGPPGTGKTMSASVLAGELSLPLFSVRLDGLITKFMGETASKLRIVFDAMEATRGVYLFDEVDALAATRESTNDVGEIRRVLNSLLQFLEQDQSRSLIVATSNLPDSLDRALSRRFDSTVEYPLPSAAQANKVVRNRLAGLDLGDVNWRTLSRLSAGLSHAEVTLAAESAAKEAIMRGDSIVTTSALSAAFDERQQMRSAV